MFCSKAHVRLIQGTIFAGAMLLAPSAFAHIYGSRSVETHHHGFIGERHQHHSTLSSRHHSHHLAATKRTHGVMAARYEPAYGEARPERARLSRAEYDAMMKERRQRRAADEHEDTITAELNLTQSRKGREHYDGQRLAADEREAAMTAKLNLAELQKAQSRDDEIARWKLEYGGSASG